VKSYIVARTQPPLPWQICLVLLLLLLFAAFVALTVWLLKVNRKKRLHCRLKKRLKENIKRNKIIEEQV